MICARRTSPAPSFCERVIRAGLCASSSLNPRTRSVIGTSPAWTRAPCNAPDPEKSYPTCRMHHLVVHPLSCLRLLLVGGAEAGGGSGREHAGAHSGARLGRGGSG